MPDKTIIYWRDIPAQVIVRAGRKSEKRELPERFITAIDRAAMVSGAKDSEAYLAEWRRSDPVSCAGDPAAEADAAVAEIERDYPIERLAALANNGGRDVTPS